MVASMDELPVDPDCQGGKHKACLGETYDELLDKWVECGCPCHSQP
jgi:hypothetical protein